MKLYLDDERQPPEGWVLAKTPKECIEHLRSGNVEHLSLDHDLGDDKLIGTGNDVLVWIEEQVATNGFVPPKIDIHSANSSARLKMEQGIAAMPRLQELFGKS